MNYKQRYEDILAMAKELREANQSDEGINRWIDKIFPELAEFTTSRSFIFFISRFKENIVRII